MAETAAFRVLKEPYYRRFRMVLPLLLLVFALSTLTMWFPSTSDEIVQPPVIIMSLALLLFPCVLLLAPKAYEIDGGTVFGRYIFGRRRLKLPLDGAPIIVHGSLLGSPDISVCNRRKIFRFHEVEDQARLSAAIASLLPATGVRSVPRRFTYSGLAWMNICSSGIFFFLSVGAIAIVAIVFYLSGRLESLFVGAPFILVFILALVYLLLGLNVRVHRDGSVLYATNLFRKVTHALDAASALSTSQDSPFRRGKILTAIGSFALPVSFGTDRRLNYDVFAIADGSFRFTEDSAVTVREN